MAPVRLEPGASGSRVKHSTTEPLRSLVEVVVVAVEAVDVVVANVVGV